MSISLIKLLLFCFLPFSAHPVDGGTSENTRHPFYVSVAEIENNATNKSLEISIKFFTDDFEHTLENNYKVPLDINAAKEKASFDKFIPDYINRHFAINVNAKPVRLDYVGYEVQGEAAYCYFEVANVSAVKRMDLSNSLLHDFSKEQMNIMHVTINGKRQSQKVDYPNSHASFLF